jgi:hypothetical protein
MFDSRNQVALGSCRLKRAPVVSTIYIVDSSTYVEPLCHSLSSDNGTMGNRSSFVLQLSVCRQCQVDRHAKLRRKRIMNHEP